MIKILAVATAAAVLSTCATQAAESTEPAPQKQVTIDQCISVANGIRALDWSGEPLNYQGSPPADAKQYKLGALRVPLGFLGGSLQSVVATYTTSVRKIMLEIGDGKPVDPKFDSVKYMRYLQESELAAQKPCPVTLPQFRISEFNVGDKPDQNQIPPSVIGALAPILTP